MLLLKELLGNFRSKTSKCKKLNNFSDIQNDVLMHRESLTLTARGSSLVVRIYDLYRRHILTSKVDPRKVRVKNIYKDCRTIT